MRKGTCLIALALLTVSAASYAASDGTLGTTSTGTTEVTLSMADTVKITKLQDIFLPVSDSNEGANGWTTACIYKNTAISGDATYAITATSGNSTGDSFIALDPNLTEQAIYTAEWDADGTRTQLTSGVKLADAGTANTTSETCEGNTGGVNASFHVTFAPDDIMSLPQGTYTDTVQLTVSPT